MDSAVSLAMMRKAQLVFETAETFLSFPPTALAFEADDFSFLRGDMNSGKLAALREFSQQVDRVGRGPVADPAEQGRLSEVYAEVLATAQLAASSRTAAEEAEFAAATRVLYVTAADGTREDSPALKAYKQYRDAWFRGQEDYNSRKIDASYSSDPAAKERWASTEEPALRRYLDDLEREWSAKGFRAEIDAARSTEERLGARAPAVLWQSWKAACNPDVDQLTDPTTNQTFFPSAFSPSNIFEAGEWSRFTLAGDAVLRLAAECPPELRGRLGEQVDLDIQSLSFEFTSLRVERSWFTPNVFVSRFWTLPASAEPISGGGGTAGRCPAYVAALVLARRLQVALKPQSGRNDQALHRLTAAHALSIASLRIATTAAPVPGRPIVLGAAKAPVRATVVAAPAAAAGVSPIAAPGRLRIPVGPRVRPIDTAKHLRLLAQLDHATFTIPARPAVPRPPVPVPQPSPAPPSDDVYILAFICKRLPRCPDPDPALQW